MKPKSVLGKGKGNKVIGVFLILTIFLVSIPIAHAGLGNWFKEIFGFKEPLSVVTTNEQVEACERTGGKIVEKQIENETKKDCECPEGASFNYDRPCVEWETKFVDCPEREICVKGGETSCVKYKEVEGCTHICLPIGFPQVEPTLGCRWEYQYDEYGCLIGRREVCIDDGISGCQEYWWFDDEHRTCSQKEFCGAFTYLGLRTFKTEEECLEGLCPVFADVMPKCKENEELKYEIGRKDEKGCLLPPYYCIEKEEILKPSEPVSPEKIGFFERIINFFKKLFGGET